MMPHRHTYRSATKQPARKTLHGVLRSIASHTPPGVQLWVCVCTHLRVFVCRGSLSEIKKRQKDVIRNPKHMSGAYVRRGDAPPSYIEKLYKPTSFQKPIWKTKKHFPIRCACVGGCSHAVACGCVQGFIARDQKNPRGSRPQPRAHKRCVCARVI